jgi:pimeloyl-ACP methyl ester carboxylesterase
MEPARIDAQDVQVRIASPIDGLQLFLRHAPARTTTAGGPVPVVLYIHGGTFPSALSIAYHCAGRSWCDELVAAGFHVWGLDFHGFGGSDPYPGMGLPADGRPALGRAEAASEQLERAVHFVCGHHRVAALSIIAHSWGTIAAGLFAGRCPELLSRLVFFAPITPRATTGEAISYPAWRLVTLPDQWKRFTEDVPQGEPGVLERSDFDDWGQRYLDCDPESRLRSPASVKTPSGPWQDIASAGAGGRAYDPALIRSPVSIIRGEWDQASTADDAHRLFDELTASPIKRLVTISRATHLMHLETGRFALYREAETFLRGNDVARSAANRNR